MKPKFTVYQVIQKSMILWGIKHELKIYYRWELEKRKKPVKLPCLVVDYDKNKREWNIFLYDDKKILSCSIDDITGTGTIKSFDNVN